MRCIGGMVIMPLACGGFEPDCLATVILKIVYLKLPSHNNAWNNVKVS